MLPDWRPGFTHKLIMWFGGVFTNGFESNGFQLRGQLEKNAGVNGISKLSRLLVRDAGTKRAGKCARGSTLWCFGCDDVWPCRNKGLFCCFVVYFGLLWSALFCSGLPCSSLLFCALLCSGLMWSGLPYSAPLCSDLLYCGLLYSTLPWCDLVCSILLCSVWSDLLCSALIWSALFCSALMWSGLIYAALLCSHLVYTYCGLLYSSLLYSALLWSALFCSALMWSGLIYAALLCSHLVYTYCGLLYSSLLCHGLLYYALFCSAVLCSDLLCWTDCNTLDCFVQIVAFVFGLPLHHLSPLLLSDRLCISALFEGRRDETPPPPLQIQLP
jgi:hypothetical protein